MGYVSTPRVTALQAFANDYAQRTDVNRDILNHLLHDAFPDDAAAEPEVDLVNDPAPPPERIQQVLGRYPFRDIPVAYENLMALATEKIRFLSTRRCRHFLAAIAPRLLAAIAATPEPDTTLVNLSRVSDSLGGKAALWELSERQQAVERDSDGRRARALPTRRQPGFQRAAIVIQAQQAFKAIMDRAVERRDRSHDRIEIVRIGRDRDPQRAAGHLCRDWIGSPESCCGGCPGQQGTSGHLERHEWSPVSKALRD